MITRVNETLAQLVGREAASLVGQPFSSLLSPGSRIYHETHFAPLVRLQGEVAEVSAEVVANDGSRMPVLLHATESDAADSPVRIAVMPAPARRRFEQELHEARRSADARAAQIRLLYRVIAAVSGAVIPSEVIGGFERAIGEVPNTRAEVWLHWDANHLVRSRSDGRESPEILGKQGQDDIAEVWRTREPLDDDDSGVVVVPILHGLEILGVLRVESVDMDVDLARSLAAELSQGLQQAALQERKDLLLGMAAHDLRTPLTLIAGYAELLEVHAADRLTEKDQQLLQEIILGARRMSSLVGDVLEMSSLESGMMVLTRTATDLASLAARSIADHAAHAADKEISVTLDVQGDATVVVDERRIGQVLDNLVSNAVKYGRLGSEVAVRIRGDAHSVRLEVEDQGEGILSDELGQVFQPFRKTSSRTTGGESSTGLGLSIARSIVEAHGGAVAVSSTSGVGSVFTVTLPRHVTTEDGAP